MRIILIGCGPLPARELLKLLLPQEPRLTLALQDFPDPTPLVRLCVPATNDKASQELQQGYKQSYRRPKLADRNLHNPAALTRWRKHLRFRG
jgi:hypothetical protein